MLLYSSGWPSTLNLPALTPKHLDYQCCSIHLVCNGYSQHSPQQTHLWSFRVLTAVGAKQFSGGLTPVQIYCPCLSVLRITHARPEYKEGARMGEPLDTLAQ